MMLILAYRMYSVGFLLNLHGRQKKRHNNCAGVFIKVDDEQCYCHYR
jgi:hypothetical protein